MDKREHICPASNPIIHLSKPFIHPVLLSYGELFAEMTEGREMEGVPALDGLFIQPILNLSWGRPRWEAFLGSIAELGIRTLILGWSASNGRSVYPSGHFEMEFSMGTDDLVGTFLEISELMGLEVILGLDGCRTTFEDHTSPVDAPLERSSKVAEELVRFYGDSPSFGGFYIPYELEEPPGGNAGDLLEGIVSVCHSLAPGKPVCYSAWRPKLTIRGRNWETDDGDYEVIWNDRRLRWRWAGRWGDLLESSKLDVLILRDDVGSGRNTPEGALEDLKSMSNICRKRDVELWSQLGLYSPIRCPEDRCPPCPHPVRFDELMDRLGGASNYAERLIGFQADFLDPDSDVDRERRRELYEGYRSYVRSLGIKPMCRGKPSRTAGRSLPKPKYARDTLREKADRIEEELRRHHILEGQVITVLHTGYDLDHPANEWQEDADWLTGLYAAAESFRYAVTGEQEAREFARESFNALHTLSTVSGVPGVVARCFRRALKGDMGSGRKRWKKTGNFYWATDISRDQLSGHLFGMAVYFDLVADDEERDIIRKDLSDIVGSIVDNDMRAIDWDGKPTIHGNFWVSPLFALTILKIAYHITGDGRFQEKYLELIDPHFFLGHALKQAAVMEDPFYEHYHHDSPLYHLLQYETDPRILRKEIRAINLLYRDVKGNGNVFIDFDYGIYHPESEAARKGVAELILYDPDHLEVRRWADDLRRMLAEGSDPRLEDKRLVETLRYSLESEKPPSGGRAAYVPLDLRCPKEFWWNYYPGEELRIRPGRYSHHGIDVRYSGVDYLLVYWMGRYHGFIR